MGDSTYSYEIEGDEAIITKTDSSGEVTQYRSFEGFNAEAFNTNMTRLSDPMFEGTRQAIMGDMVGSAGSGHMDLGRDC